MKEHQDKLMREGEQAQQKSILQGIQDAMRVTDGRFDDLLRRLTALESKR
jgi:hypothetical protein